MPSLRPTWIIVDGAGASRAGRPPWARLLGREAALDEAALIISHGGIVVFPTETFYGVAVRAEDQEAVARLIAAKGREGTRTVPVIAADRDQADAFAQMPPELADLAERFWPGPLTLALSPRRPQPPPISSGGGTVGIRVSSHPIACGLARRAGIITATSANMSGSAPTCDPSNVSPGLLRKVDAVIDAGRCAGGSPSTVVGVEDSRVVVYRTGAVSLANLASALGYEPDAARQ